MNESHIVTYSHDCSDCVFLERTDTHDLYVCAKADYAKDMGPSLIARYGNDGGDYLSMPWNALMKAPSHAVSPVLKNVMEVVLKKVNTENGPALGAALTPYLRETLTPSLIYKITSKATGTLRESKSTCTDSRWGAILGVLHFETRHEMSDPSSIELVLHGGG